MGASSNVTENITIPLWSRGWCRLKQIQPLPPTVRFTEPASQGLTADTKKNQEQSFFIQSRPGHATCLDGHWSLHNPQILCRRGLMCFSNHNGVEPHLGLQFFYLLDSVLNRGISNPIQTHPAQQQHHVPGSVPAHQLWRASKMQPGISITTASTLRHSSCLPWFFN